MAAPVSRRWWWASSSCSLFSCRRWPNCPLQAAAPVLILVGFLMSGLIKGIDFDEGFSALLTIILMPLTFSITVGIGAGFVMFVLVKLVRGKAAEVHPLMWVVALTFLSTSSKRYSARPSPPEHLQNVADSGQGASKFSCGLRLKTSIQRRPDF